MPLHVGCNVYHAPSRHPIVTWLLMCNLSRYLPLELANFIETVKLVQAVKIKSCLECCLDENKKKTKHYNQPAKQGEGGESG